MWIAFILHANLLSCSFHSFILCFCSGALLELDGLAYHFTGCYTFCAFHHSPKTSLSNIPSPFATKYKSGIDPRHSASDTAHLHTPLLGSHAHALCPPWGDSHGHVAFANADPLGRIPLKNISLFFSTLHPLLCART